MTEKKLKPCPYCGAKAFVSSPIKPTLEEALQSNPVINCTEVHCIARHVCATPEEWNTRSDPQRSELLKLVEDMAKRFRDESAFLSGEDDSSTDRAVGQAYGDCAKEVEYLISKFTAKAVLK